MNRKDPTIRLVLLVFGLFVIAVPYLWIVLTAIKRPVDAAAVPPMILSPTTLNNFAKLVDDNYFSSLLNSVIITGLTTAATLVLGVPAGYAFARGRFPGRAFLGGWLLFSRMVPPVIFIIPLFLFFHDLGLIDSFGGLMLAYMTGLLPFAIWMSASYFADIPVDIEDAARVDGCTRFQAFYWTALPLALPGIVTVANLIAIAAWGEYFIPLILAGPKTTPATVGVVNFVGYDAINWGAMAAAALMLVVPVFLLTVAAQRGLLRGLTAGAVKGFAHRRITWDKRVWSQEEPYFAQGGQDARADDPELRLRKLAFFVHLEPRLRHVSTHPRLRALIDQLIGPGSRMIQDMALLKPPFRGSEKPWHQDAAYFDWTPLGGCRGHLDRAGRGDDRQRLHAGHPGLAPAGSGAAFSRARLSARRPAGAGGTGGDDSAAAGRHSCFSPGCCITARHPT